MKMFKPEKRLRTWMYDIIIIGAGPAGCFTAFELSKAKINRKPIKILILEASASLERLKPCGGDIEREIVDDIPELKRIVVGEVLNFNY